MSSFIKEAVGRAAGAVEGAAKSAIAYGKDLGEDALSAVGLRSETYYPPPAFNFSVKVLGAVSTLTALTKIDSSFAEVSGLSVTWNTEQVAEGGENRFAHNLPIQPRYSNVMLKRGVVTGSSFFGEWVGQSIGAKLNYGVTAQTLMIMLNGTGRIPLVCWVLMNAYPVRIETAAMNSTSNDVLMETIELSYTYFERITPHSLASLGVSLARLGLSLV